MRAVFAVLVAASLASPSLADSPEPPPGGVRLGHVSHSGSACPPGTLVARLSADAAAFTVMFSDLWASASGNGPDPAFQRRSCDVVLGLAVPAGWSYTVATVDFHGYAAVEPGARAVQTSVVYFPPAPPPVTSPSLALAGPFDANYDRQLAFPPSAQAWSPCDGSSRALRLSAVVTAQARRNSRALITVDAIDGLATHRYALLWRRCAA